MEKQKLLKKIEEKEFARILSLTDSEFFAEFIDYCCIEEDYFEKYRVKPKSELINVYMEDFMTWKEDYSEIELLTFLQEQYKGRNSKTK